MCKEWPTAGVGKKTGKQGVMEEETEEVSQVRSGRICGLSYGSQPVPSAHVRGSSNVAK